MKCKKQDFHSQQIVNTIDDEVTCCICYFALIEVHSSCDHHFCNSCILAWIDLTENNKNCPACFKKTKFTKIDTSKIPEFYNHAYDDIRDYMEQAYMFTNDRNKSKKHCKELIKEAAYLEDNNLEMHDGIVIQKELEFDEPLIRTAWICLFIACYLFIIYSCYGRGPIYKVKYTIRKENVDGMSFYEYACRLLKKYKTVGKLISISIEYFAFPRIYEEINMYFTLVKIIEALGRLIVNYNLLLDDDT